MALKTFEELNLELMREAKQLRPVDFPEQEDIQETELFAAPEVASEEEWVRDMLGFSWNEAISEADEFLDEPETAVESGLNKTEAIVGAVEEAPIVETTTGMIEATEVTEVEGVPEAEEVPETEKSTRTELPGKKIARKRPAQKSSQKPRLFAILSDILFYTAILVVLFSTVIAKPTDGSPKTIRGFSYFTVLTTSMQSEMPKGSFILVHETDPQELEIGDNITFMRSENISVTHQIEDIYEDYDGSDMRAFQTKGVDNVNPDAELVHEKDVVGKVILVIPRLGAFISYLNSHIVLVFVLFGMSVLFVFGLRRFYEYLGKKKTAIRSDYDINEAVAS